MISTVYISNLKDKTFGFGFGFHEQAAANNSRAFTGRSGSYCRLEKKKLEKSK